MSFSRDALGVGLLAFACAAGAQTATSKTYIVQLADAPAATYTGGLRGLPATRPAAGSKLDVNTAGVRSYRNYLDAKRNTELTRVAGVRVVHRYDIAFNGFSAQMTEAQAKQLKTSASVLSVVEAPVYQLDTTRTPGFLGLSTPGGLWSQLDSQSRLVKGENVIIGVIDSGFWPENASFGDKVDATGKPVAYNQAGTQVYGPAPAKWRGVCTTGEGFTSAMCNNKMIGARFYVDGWLAGGNTLHPHEFKSPRDGGGHGSHTASTSGGNENSPAVVASGASGGTMSGIAPRARIAAYKVCWDGPTRSTTDSGCGGADILKAIDDAVADGVDVINYSISGSQTSFVDSVEIAYLNAAAAGVFVAASAGNSGPANQVAHISPWLMTVAASTHDRASVADLTLGDSSVYTGSSVNPSLLANKPMVLSSAIPASGAAVADANLCFANSLDATAAIGKIVVCDRGTNDRVAKSAEVKRIGGVGMVLINPSNNTLVADFHSVPTVHLQNTARSAVRAYAANAGATATMGAYYNQPGVVAPVMASFSSRGPNKGNGNILKPDISGPGVDIIAGYIADVSDAQYSGMLAGTFAPPGVAASLQGTSMSSPHIAGAGALLKQLYPTWTPSAIKSALMTSTNDIKLASGALDPDRWGYGAGHLNPTPASNPGLVYDATPADYGRFLCGQSLTPPAGIGSCATLGRIDPWNLNLASITASEVPGALTVTRRVTNVGTATATYVASTSLAGWTAQVSPSSLTLAPGASASFTVTLTRTTAAAGDWAFGSLTWSDGVHTVRSPLSARGVLLATPAQVDFTGSVGAGAQSFSVVPGIDGAMRVQATGLVPAALSTGNVATGATQCFNVVVPTGALYARFQLFNSDTQGGGSTDLDLTVYSGPGGTGSTVGSSGGGQSDEVVSLSAPAAGTYSACVAGFATPAGGAAFTLSSWVVGSAAGAQTLVATGPRLVTRGVSASINARWSVSAAARYLGYVSFVDATSATIGTTVLTVDNRAP